MCFNALPIDKNSEEDKSLVHRQTLVCHNK